MSRFFLGLHRWLSLIIGIQILLWLLGGLVMTALPIERVRSEHILRQTDPVTINLEGPDRERPITPLAALALPAFESATLTTLGNRQIWRVKTNTAYMLFDAKTAALVSPVSPQFVTDIAATERADAKPPDRIALLDVAPTEIRHTGPVWAAYYSEPAGYTVYIHPNSGAVLGRRSTLWRVFDFFWKLHVMDYDDGREFNHPLIIISALLATLVGLSGIAVLINWLRRRRWLPR